MAVRNARRRLKQKSSTGPRGGKFQTTITQKVGPQGGVTRHTEKKNKRTGRTVSRKTKYIGKAD